MKRSRQSGIALVITLVMLAVVTFMAVVFLGISRRERVSVTVTAEQTDARLMADQGALRAQAEIVSRMVAQGNPASFDLLISTNFYNPNGYNVSLRRVAPTNINYEYTLGPPRQAIREGEEAQPQFLANQQYDPRAPVFVPTNGPFIGDWRFYLDLNRNGRFESNGLRPVITSAGGFLKTNGLEVAKVLFPDDSFVKEYVIGDPLWVGVLDKADRPHGRDNRFLGRYAYLVVPEGKALDLNTMHNQAKRLGQSTEGFMRNQGVGAWELNLAGFLADLNANVWARPNQGYILFNTNLSATSQGSAFVDALSLLRFRYNDSYNNLATAGQWFRGQGDYPFANDRVDGYSDGPLIFDMKPRAGLILENDETARPWPGSDSPRRYESVLQLLNTNAFSPEVGLVSKRLRDVGTNQGSYDRYTYYRLLAQMGVDSPPALTHRLRTVFPESGQAIEYSTNKIHLNYANAIFPSNNAYHVQSADKFESWTPAGFFTNAADRLVRMSLRTLTNVIRDDANRITEINYYRLLGDTYVRTNFSLTNIQIFYDATKAPVGYQRTNSEYTASLHQLLQLAANIYDATTNRNFAAANAYPQLPSVFRPLFLNKRTNIVIAGFREVREADLELNEVLHPWRDLNNPVDRDRLTPGEISEDNVYGVPWVIGAKKGLPNFNEFALQSFVQVTRKLEARKASAEARGFSQTNQMYLLSISNVFGLEAWNAYTNVAGYPRALELRAAVNGIMILTNRATNGGFRLNKTNAYAIDRWGPAGLQVLAAGAWKPMEFQVPILTNVVSLPDSAYYFSREGTAKGPFVGVTNNLGYETNQGFKVPDWYMLVSNSVRYALVDRASRRIVDFVNLTGLTNGVHITSELSGDRDVHGGGYSADGGFWDNARVGGVASNIFMPTVGIKNQLEVSLGNTKISPEEWQSYSQQQTEGMDREKSIDVFRVFLGLSPLTPRWTREQLQAELGPSTSRQAPFVPTRKLYLYKKWQANDPMVHYMAQDLEDRTAAMDVMAGLTNDYFITLTNELQLLDVSKVVRLETNVVQLIQPPNAPIPVENLGKLNERFSPWGGNPQRAPLLNEASAFLSYSRALKDPLVTRPDDWDFPTNKFANLGQLGRVHRGTPWQTIYLKSEVPSPGIWYAWSGNVGTHPANDWKLLDAFTVAASDNAARGLVSVNQNLLPTWSAVLAGVFVYTNNLADDVVQSLQNDRANPRKPTYAVAVAEPVGQTNRIDRVATNQPLYRLVEGLNRTRAAFVNTDRRFPYMGAVLQTPELSVHSPFLRNPRVNWRNLAELKSTAATQVLLGISEDVYEQIPRQIFSLLKTDEPRVTIYAFGQALKPADRSILLSGDYRGMCTNYQVTGEVATKTVLRLEGDLGQNPRAVIESYKVLPAD